MNSRFALAATLRSNRLPLQPQLCFFPSKPAIHLSGVLLEISIPGREPNDFKGAQHKSRFCRCMRLKQP